MRTRPGTGGLADPVPAGKGLLSAAILGLGALLLHAFLAAGLSRTGVLDEINVLYDADPNLHVQSFGDGWAGPLWGGRNFAHPNLANFVNPPVRFVARALVLCRLSSSALLPLRHRLAKLVSPVASALTLATAFLLFAKLGLTRAAAALLASLSLASFSDLLFGSIPESFGLGAMAMAFVLLLAVDAIGEDRPLKPALWVFAGVLAVGITVTHVAELWIAAFIAARSKGLKASRALAFAAALGLVVGLLTVGFYEVGQRFYGAPPFSPMATGQIQELGKLHSPVDVALAFSDTLLPAPPLAFAYEEVRQPHEFILTYRRAAGPVSGRTPRALLVFLVLLLAGLGWRNAAPRQRMCALLAGALLTFHFLLFLFYGTELFLYSAHWELPLVFLCAGAFFHTGRLRRLVVLGLAGFTLLVALNSVLVWTSIFRALNTPHRTPVLLAPEEDRRGALPAGSSGDRQRVPPSYWSKMT